MPEWARVIYLLLAAVLVAPAALAIIARWIRRRPPRD
jgi:hypothetical protein